MFQWTRYLGVGALAGIVLIAAGCGDGGSDTSLAMSVNADTQSGQTDFSALNRSNDNDDRALTRSPADGASDDPPVPTQETGDSQQGDGGSDDDPGSSQTPPAPPMPANAEQDDGDTGNDGNTNDPGDDPDDTGSDGNANDPGDDPDDNGSDGTANDPGDDPVDTGNDGNTPNDDQAGSNGGSNAGPSTPPNPSGNGGSGVDLGGDDDPWLPVNNRQSDPVATPEPTTVVLGVLGAGALTLAATRRRRRN